MSERITIYRQQLERITAETKNIKVKERSVESLQRYNTPRITVLSEAAGRAAGLFAIMAMYELKIFKDNE